MKRPSRVLFMVVAANLYLAGPALAQATSNKPNSGNVAQQFKSGANRVGQGAAQIGEGIKQGAILTWHAIRDGVASTTARFNDGRGTSSTKESSTQSTRQ